MKPKRIIILDDHTLFLKGMSLILKENNSDYEIFPYYSIAKLKSDNLNFKNFSLLISDIELPNEDSFALFKTLKKKHKKLPILVVSMHKKNAIISKCKKIGIDGYILKDEDDQLANAVEIIIEGGKYYSDTIIKFCKETENTFIKISNREEEIIKLIAQGFNNNEISDKLFISIETIKTHKKNIRIKLEVETTAEIIDYAKKNFLG